MRQRVKIESAVFTGTVHGIKLQNLKLKRNTRRQRVKIESAVFTGTVHGIKLQNLKQKRSTRRQWVKILHVEYATRRIKHGILSISSLFYKYNSF